MDRMDKINQQIKREVSQMLLMGELRDPRIHGVTITYADVSRDLSWAHIGYSVLTDDPDELREVHQGLKSAAGAVRRLIAQRIKIRHIPQVKFVYDNSISQSAHMAQVFGELEQERLRRGEGPAPAPDAQEGESDDQE